MKVSDDLQKIRDAIKLLPERDLISLNDMIVEEVQAKRKQRAKLMRALLKKGSIVYWTNRAESKTWGIIIEKKRTNAIVQITDCEMDNKRVGKKVKVHMNWLTKYEEWNVPHIDESVVLNTTFNPNTGDFE
tara:strand:- start:417 stop:809 length:393 start_codon:yes stop_codon:yes gene_type:complete